MAQGVSAKSHADPLQYALNRWGAVAGTSTVGDAFASESQAFFESGFEASVRTLLDADVLVHLRGTGIRASPVYIESDLCSSPAMIFAMSWQQATDESIIAGAPTATSAKCGCGKWWNDERPAHALTPYMVGLRLSESVSVFRAGEVGKGSDGRQGKGRSVCCGPCPKAITSLLAATNR